MKTALQLLTYFLMAFLITLLFVLGCGDLRQQPDRETYWKYQDLHGQITKLRSELNDLREIVSHQRTMINIHSKQFQYVWGESDSLLGGLKSQDDKESRSPSILERLQAIENKAQLTP